MAAAAAGSILRVLNIVGGILRFIPFASENFGSADSVASVIKFTVGLDVSGGLQNAGGDLPDVRLFNEAGEFIGISTDPASVRDSSTAEIRVKHNDNNGQQTAYALFSANDNAVCVASISITWPNGDQYGWVGDWGQACGGAWYFSNVFIKGSDYKPSCLWIDANGDQPQTGFQVHFPEFVSKDDQQAPPPPESLDYYCNAGPPFKLYTDPDPRGITYWVLNPAGRRRANRHLTRRRHHHLANARNNTQQHQPLRRLSRSERQPLALGGPTVQQRDIGRAGLCQLRGAAVLPHGRQDGVAVLRRRGASAGRVL